MKKQIRLFMLDVKDFYTEKERKLNQEYLEAKNAQKLIKDHTKYTMLNLISDSFEEYKNKYNSFEELKTIKADDLTEEQSLLYASLKKYFNNISKSVDIKRSKKFRLSDKDKDVIKANEKCFKDIKKTYEEELNKNLSYAKNKKEIKDKKKLFDDERVANINLVRTLERDRIYYKYIDKETKEEIEKPKIYKQILLFDSFLTRTLGFEEEKLTEDIFIIETLYYDIVEQLVKNGFKYMDNFYCVFTCSAGQLRKKKVVMINQNIFNTYKTKLMCGLSLDDINSYEDENGNKGCIVNKYLAYLSLTNSASDVWENFDISKAIIVNDFETTVSGIVDYIDNKTFKITPNKKEKIKITHSDGAGLYLTNNTNAKAFQCRLPWVKGLMVPVNKDMVLKFCAYAHDGKGQYKIRDIFDKEWDLEKDGIIYIFTKSQLKMWKYYKHKALKEGFINGWELYKQFFTSLNCEACKLNIEPDYFEDKEINYQFLQSLTNMSKEDSMKFIADAYNEIKNAYDNTLVMRDILGATKKNKKRNGLQEAIHLYPELLHDYHVKDMLASAISSKKTKLKSGKFIIKNTKRMFIVPDVFAWLQFMIEGNDTPEGLLKNNEVSCKLFDNGIKLDVLRSPSLYKEHSINTNIINDNTNDWFITNCLYTSCHSIMSKLLMFDVDGDDATIVSDPNWVKIAEEEMNGVNPLYYDLGSGKPEEINNNSIWESMKTAWDYGNIGKFSNRLTKIWNKGKENISGDDLRLAKIICFINNASIDAAKTKYFPDIPDKINQKFKILDNEKLPHFFIFAKNKKESQVSEINDSVVNIICKKIEDIKDNQFRYNFNKVGKFFVKNLMNNPKIINSDVYQKYSEQIIAKYEEMNKAKDKWFIKVKEAIKKSDCDEAEEIIANKSSIIYSQCKKEILSVCTGVDIKDVVDILIKYVYGKHHKNRLKSLLFVAFGDVIAENLMDINKNTFMCQGCGRRHKKKSNNQVWCDDCGKKEKLNRAIKAKNKLTKIVS